MGARERRDREFTAYVAERSVDLKRTAYLLCADPHRAEDLVQTALTKLYVAWDRIERRGAVDAYARQILVRAAIDESRRPWRREFATDRPPEGALPFPEYDDGLLAELAALPPRQRTAVVLRYWNDLSVEETARLMGCTASTVKTQAARGLERLRTLLATPATEGGA